MARGIKLDRADWSKIQIGSGVPTSSTKGNVYLNSQNGAIYTRKNSSANWSVVSGSSSSGTLDEAYDYGGSGAGRTITADSGAVAISTPDASNNATLALSNVDTTNTPNTLEITNDTESGFGIGYTPPGYSIFLTGSSIQKIWSDKSLHLGSTYPYSSGDLSSGGGVIIQSDTTSGDSLVYVSSESDSGSSLLTISSDCSSGTEPSNLEILSTGNSSSSANYIKIESQNSSGTADSYVWINADGTGTNSIRIGSTDVNEIRLSDYGNSLSSWAQAYALLSDASASEWNNYKTNFGEVSIFNALNQLSTLSSSAGGTLDDAYRYGSGGEGTQITVDIASLTLVCDDSLDVLTIHNDGGEDSIFLTGTGATSLPVQTIWSDKGLTVGNSAPRLSDDGQYGGLTVKNECSSSNSYLSLSTSTSSAGLSILNITADASFASNTATMTISSVGASDAGDTTITILSDNTTGTDEAYVLLNADGAGTNSIRIGQALGGSVNEIRFYDEGNDGSTWTQKYVLLSDGSNSEWDDFETNFGEVSIFNALNQISLPWTLSENLDVDTGTEDVDTFNPSGDGAVFWYYSVQNGANHRAGTIIACWDDSAGSVEYNDVSTSDIGDTSALSLAVDMSGATGTVRLRATAASDNWIVKASRAIIL